MEDLGCQASCKESWNVRDSPNTVMLKYHGSIDHGMGRCDLIADGSTTADLTAGESAGVDGAINGMKSLYVGSVQVRALVT
uniref:Uncharacterized protein n=1 Tax=Candidatus Methanogaster sp. ANME-2c ERB4 TaxID=2759911 RepID=A0A7G9YDY8_9EURY|nr:hypothetical protein ABPEKODN_00035 [Methanosarcinales archaeon ANME-2c ERB4]